MTQRCIHVGVHGGLDPPLIFPYLISDQKSLPVGFLIFSLRQFLRKLILFNPKSAVLHDNFQKKIQIEGNA